jgi:hypothetical protein
VFGVGGKPNGILVLKGYGDLASLPSGLFYSSFFFFYFCYAEVRTQGFMLARQVLYHLSHASCAFSLVIFELGSHFFPRLGWTAVLPFYASCWSWADR